MRSVCRLRWRRSVWLSTAAHVPAFAKPSARPLLPVVSAGIWALLHFATNPDVQRLWTFLPFYVLTVALLSFPKTRSNLALLSVSAVHGIMNLVICLVTWWLP